jgi:hypothetical protein
MTDSSGSDPQQPRKRRPRKKPAAPDTDILTLMQAGKVRLETEEDPEERRSRLSIEEAKARHEL